ncbi:MAG: ABC transporter ATP-binding protein [Actinomycetota bacterium]
MDASPVDLRAVSRSFGRVPALQGVSILAPAGEITVLLGPNGAGKTTAIRIITGALTADAGSVTVLGVDPSGPDGEDVRRRCGVVSAKPSLYDRLSGWDNLRYAAQLYGLGRGPATDQRLASAAERFGIAPALDQAVGGYSTGMKTRLALARSILHEPDLLLLDEPTSGLDPESAAAVLDLVRTMATEGRTVLLCTHLLLEAEGLADQVVMMEQGSTVLSGRPAELAQRFWPEQTLSIRVTDGHHLDRLATEPGVGDYTRTGTVARLTLTDPSVVPELVRQLVIDGAAIEAVEPFTPSLEDLYFAIRRREEHPMTAPPPPAAVDRVAPEPVGAGQ